MTRQGLKIAYIGGGSHAWARGVMMNFALEPALNGTVYLYDIDYEAALDNEIIGNKLSLDVNAESKWKYKAVKNIEEALSGADFVIISILPGTFKEIQADVHFPEKYNIIQSVGDSTGPGGYVRAMRCAPIYLGFASKIKECCPNAWVINYTNPMTLCLRLLYHGYPKIKAVGCCHEIFIVQAMLAELIEKTKKIKGIRRQDIEIEVGGVNHFTWLTKASYKGMDLFPLFKEAAEQYQPEKSLLTEDKLIENTFLCGDVIKYEMFESYGVIPCAGDRHLAEFMPAKWYLQDLKAILAKKFNVTTVDWRVKNQQEKIQLTREYVSGEKILELKNDGEEGFELIKALSGIKDFKSNINYPNIGQIEGYPLNAVVETNAIFSENKVSPIKFSGLPNAVNAMILRHVYNNEAFIDAVSKQCKKNVLEVLRNDPLCGALTREQVEEMFYQMCDSCKEYLDDFWK